MEYEFSNDPVNGVVSAKFSTEHEIFGPWLETELGHNVQMLTDILTAIEEVEAGRQREKLFAGREYSVVIDNIDVVIYNNASMNEDGEDIPEALQQEHVGFDQNERSSCGLDDFRNLLLSWSTFSR